MIQAFPQTNPKTIDNKLAEVTNLEDSHTLLNLYHSLSEPSPIKFRDALIGACVKLQGNRIFRDSSEDDRNTYIADLLDAGGYPTKDQTRWSTSYAGKSSGEVDIFVHKKDGSVFTIIEALNLDSTKKSYISLHLTKIFKYDTTGLKQNFILVYSSAQKFSQLWKRYIDYLPEIDFLYPYVSFTEIKDYAFTDIKLGKSKHIRHEEEVDLFHVFINMSV